MPTEMDGLGDFLAMLPKLPKMLSVGPRIQRWGKMTMSDFAARAFRELGGRGVPVVRIGSNVVHGYNPEAILSYLEQNK